MRNYEGEIVMVRINGRVAEKDKDGRMTGKMIPLKDGDVGKVVECLGKDLGKKIFLVSVSGGTVKLTEDSLCFPENSDVSIPAALMKKVSPEYRIRPRDMKDKGAEY